MRHADKSADLAFMPILHATSWQVTVILMTLMLYGCGPGISGTVSKTDPASESITLSVVSSSVRTGSTTMIAAIEGGHFLPIKQEGDEQHAPR